MKKIIDLFHNLSLNVVLGAILCHLMFWKLPHGNTLTNYWILTGLALATWLVYLVDRILDTNIYRAHFSVRHQFHKDNKTILKWLVMAVILIELVLCLFVPTGIFAYALLLAIGIGIYLFVLNRWLKTDKAQWVKEPVTAITYTLAVAGVSFVSMPSIFLSSWILIFMFFLTVSQNLLLFSFFENLSSQNHPNSATLYGSKASQGIIKWIGAVNLFLAITFFGSGGEYANKVGFLIALMSLILSFLPFMPSFFVRNERYRWLGDGVFLLPVLLFFLI